MNNIIILTIFTLSSLILSAIIDRNKTYKALIKGVKMFLNTLPAFLTVIILVSIFLYAIPVELLLQYLGKESGLKGMGIAACFGSVALIPGFIAFPLSALLLKNGVSYQVISVFITTLMMVGILTLPIEIKYFGIRISLLRNALSFIGAIIIGIIMGILL